MRNSSFSQIGAILILIVSLLLHSGCATSARGRYFGKTEAPKNNVLRYVSGSEPESLDPQISNGQPEARIYMALYDGLVEYHPKTIEPIPAIAKSWEAGANFDEFVFHLRDNAKWSDGTPITARDFVYSLRRGFASETTSRTAAQGFAIKYSEAFNNNQAFVKKNGSFLLAKDLAESAPVKDTASVGPETEFHKFIRSPGRLTVSGDAKERDKQLAADPKLKAALEGAELIPVKAEDIGVEAIDDYTLRITLRQPTPYFLGLLPHQFFRLVPQKAIEKYGRKWARPENIVTCGAFKVKEVRPYDTYIFEKDPNYWDAANVRLDGIEFYPVEDQATIMNLYKSGAIDAFFNHTVPGSWIDEMRNYQDEYMDFREIATSYYSANVTKPPLDDPRVRRAFSLAIDREVLSKFRKVTRPLYYQAPSGLFPDYDKAREKVGEEIRKQRGISLEEWERTSKQFDPENARELLADAGFTVRQSSDSFSCPDFPADKLSITYNSNDTNRLIAEFIQAQWKRNLGITIPLKAMEFKTFIPYRNSLQYEGFAIALWSGDYVDPYTFLDLHYGRKNGGGAGFYDANYDKLLDEANAEPDLQKRYEKLARAEYYLLDQLPVIPLTINATNWMKKPFVKGLYPNPGTLHAWKFVYIERDRAKWDVEVSNIMQNSDMVFEEQLGNLEKTQRQAK